MKEENAFIEYKDNKIKQKDEAFGNIDRNNLIKQEDEALIDVDNLLNDIDLKENILPQYQAGIRMTINKKQNEIIMVSEMNPKKYTHCNKEQRK